MRGFNALTFLGWLAQLFSPWRRPAPAPGASDPSPVAAVVAAAPAPAASAGGQQRWEFRFPSHLTGLAGFNAQLDACLETANLSAADTFALHLLFDELLTNVIKYAHPEGGEHEIAVQFSLGPEHFEICIQDDGVFFDPTIVPPPPVEDAVEADPLPLEERVVGGWGLSLVRKTADVFEYERRGGENHVRVIKRTAIPEAPPADDERRAAVIP